MNVTFFPNDKRESSEEACRRRGSTSPRGRSTASKLVGFGVWERRNGARNVTFPSRQYSVNGERRSFALLRPRADAGSQDRLRDLILGAYKEHENALAEAG